DGRLRRTNNNLARMAGFLHQPECVRDPFGVKHAIGQGLIDACFKTADDICKKLLCERGPLHHELIGINPEIAEIVAEELQADAIVLVEIALAEFKKAPEGTKQAEIAMDGFARKGVQDNIHALAIRDAHDVVGKVEGARIEN